MKNENEDNREATALEAEAALRRTLATIHLPGVSAPAKAQLVDALVAYVDARVAAGPPVAPRTPPALSQSESLAPLTTLLPVHRTVEAMAIAGRKHEVVTLLCDYGRFATPPMIATEAATSLAGLLGDDDLDEHLPREAWSPLVASERAKAAAAELERRRHRDEDNRRKQELAELDAQATRQRLAELDRRTA